MPLTLNDLYATPNHYLHAFDGEDAVFVPMDRAAYRRSIFLDARISPAANGSMRIPAAALATPNTAPGPVGWIFHVAHCGSTLLARALDQGDSLVLREPLALRQAAVAGDEDRLRLVGAMLARRYRADRPTVVKANVPVNFVLPQLAAAVPNARALFLYVSLRAYLPAILRTEQHREWLGRVSGQLALHLPAAPVRSHAEAAAALWAAQVQRFAQGLAAWPMARSLEAERFFAEPAAVLPPAARLLGAEEPEGGFTRVVAGPLFATYSKNPDIPFDNLARVERQHALAATLAAEVAEAEHWVDRHAPAARGALAGLEAARLG